jgi:hypothetical protein
LARNVDAPDPITIVMTVAADIAAKRPKPTR